MNLTRNCLEKYCENCKDIKDNRKKVSRAVFSYLDECGQEYRRSFIAPPLTPEMKFWDIAPLVINI